MDTNEIKAALTALATHLAGRRADILRNWQGSVEADPELTSASSLSRLQFIDHVPQVLDAFERRLQARDPVAKEVAFEDQKASAAEHGLQRWQQGYHQRESIREWSHLHYWVLSEIDDYGGGYPELQTEILPIARRALVRLCGEGVCESAGSYERLQRSEAASRLRELQGALQELQTLERQRAGAWREAAHDLRGTVGVISNASLILARESDADPPRHNAAQMLQRSVTSLRALLNDLIDLARLEAGEERRRLAEFDAAVLLRNYCEGLRPLAVARNLFLKIEGPPTLTVEGDAVKVQRIAQNLILNALSVTTEGGVCVQWQERQIGQVRQWLMVIQDSGPGFDSTSPAAPFERVLREATREAHSVDPRHEPPPPTLSSQTEPGGKTAGGEGIGLSIVKRLCELLDASLELETSSGTGSTFRVVFPRSYAASPRTG